VRGITSGERHFLSLIVDGGSIAIGPREARSESLASPLMEQGRNRRHGACSRAPPLKPRAG
jgi:hypothetical protein